MNNPMMVEMGSASHHEKNVAVTTNVKPPISFRPSPEEIQTSQQSSSQSTADSSMMSQHEHSQCSEDGCSTEHDSAGGEERPKKHKKKEGRLDYRRLTARNGGVFGSTIRVFQVFNICFYFYVGKSDSDVPWSLRAPAAAELRGIRQQDPHFPDPYYAECKKSKPNLWKPDRAHFCSISQVLVPRLDHYCPFVIATIGFRNHGMFFLLCFYHTLGIGVGLIGFALWMWYNYLEFVKTSGLAISCMFSLFVLVDVSAILSMLSFTAYMLYYNLIYIKGNITTLDWYENQNSQTVDGGMAVGRIRGIHDFGLLYNLKAFGLLNPWFWLPRIHSDRYEGYYFPRLDRQGEIIPFKEATLSQYIDPEKGIQIAPKDLTELQQFCFQKYQGQTLLYPPSMQHLVK